MSQEQEQNNFPTIYMGNTDTSSTESLAVDLLTTTDIKPQMANKQVTYTEKTNRLLALSQCIKSVTPLIWAAVILIVIIPLIGRGLIGSSISDPSHPKTHQPSAEVKIDRGGHDPNKLDRAMVTAIKNAHTSAKNFADKELDAWVDELMTRVDGSFLDWYFNYFNQKKMEFSAPFVWLSAAVTHWIDTNSPPPEQKVAEKFTEDFQREFANRVLIPKASQLKLENLTNETVDLYASELSSNIDQIQSSYQIPQGQWERYLDNIAFTINGTGGIVSNLSLKILIGGSSYMFFKAAMIPVVGKVGSKVAISLAGKAAAKIATKTGGVVAAKIGAQFLDPIVGVGIIIWDLWDYHHSVEVSKPVLKEALLKYLKEVKTSLLNNPENGIMSAINQVEEGIYKSIASATHPA